MPRNTSRLLALALSGALAGCAWSPGFDHEQGEYADPDIVLIGGERSSGAIPQEDCPSATIYSSDAETVQSCQNAAPIVDAVCSRAEDAANALARTVSCGAICPEKAVTNRFKGWSCGGNPTPIVVTCGVEVQVLCWGMY